MWANQAWASGTVPGAPTGQVNMRWNVDWYGFKLRENMRWSEVGGGLFEVGNGCGWS